MLSKNLKKKALNFRRFKESVDWSREDQERWRKSPKGKLEGEWWLNRCHAETENRFNESGSWEKSDANFSSADFGKVYVDNITDKPVDPNYVKSLLKTWGEPNGSIRESKEEEDDGKPGIYQVRRVSGIGSSLGEEVSNIEPQVVCEFDTKEEAEERKAELEASVLPEEKELLGTSYEIHKVPLKVEE